MHFNSFDISKARKGMSDVMREYAVAANRCRREIIINYFRYKSTHNFDPIHTCCDFHKNSCQCGSCSVETVSDLNSSFNEITITESSSVLTPSTLDRQNVKLLHDDLIAYWLSLNPGR